MSDMTKEIEKLKERVEELEFNELFYQNKLKELEEKRIYYRKDREDKLSAMFKVFTELKDDDEITRINIKIKDMTIHEKYEFMTEAMSKLCIVERYIHNDEPYCLYEEHIGDPNGKETMDIMSDLFSHFAETYPDEVRDNVLEELNNNPPKELRDRCVLEAMDDGEIVGYETYDEVDDIKRDYEENVESAIEYIEAKQKWTKYDPIDNINTGNNKYDSNADTIKNRFIILYDYIDRQREEIEKYKAGYETLKEDKDDDAIEMVENIMNKTSEIVERDIERVKEINRLKEKVNKYIRKLEVITSEFIDPTHPHDLVGSMRFCKGSLMGYIEKHYGANIKLSYDFITSLSWSIRYEINKMLMGENLLVDKLKDDISRLVHRLVNKKESLSGDVSYIIKGNDEDKEPEEKYIKEYNENGYERFKARFTYPQIYNDKEKLIDINNY